MPRVYLATEQDIAAMIDDHSDMRVDLDLLDEMGVDSMELDKFDYMLHRLASLYHKHIDEFPKDKVWLEFTIEVVGGGRSEVTTDMIESFDDSSPYFICDSVILGDYEDYIISMFIELPDDKSEVAKRMLDKGEM